ncbi:MAG TPA: TonB-dependent receptor [Rhizomicrobium sp.]|nr:TonB-dependent receptor [Rhizomicrobium sp.]
MRPIPPLLLALLLLASPAVAQEGVTSYPPSYFAANQPTTALDMMALLPGFRVQEGDSDIRGFSGTVGNVLIDGQLPTSKEEGVEDLLRRISASQVDHIELIRAAADMHGYAVLANVVRKQDLSLHGRAELEGTVTHFGTTGHRLALNLTRQGAESVLDVSASYGREIEGGRGFGTRGRFLPDGTPVRLSAYAFPELNNFADLSVAYRQPVWGGEMAFGAVLKQQREYSLVREDIYFPAPASSSGLESGRVRNGEARLDYKRPIGAWGTLNLFAVHRTEEQDEISQTMTVIDTEISRDRSNYREDVGRLAWQYQSGDWQLENGMEGAINLLHSRSTLTLNGTPVILPASNLRVEERRAEFFSAATWRINPVLVTEMGARYEMSTLTHRGGSNPVKDLSFLKPRWLTIWNPAEGHELRFLAERVVGQLDFQDFASSTSLNSNVINAGNQNLEPDRTTLLSLTWEYRFWQRASLTLEARREFISHVVDNIPVFSGGRFFNAVGNIGSGRRDMLAANWILPLDEIGLSGVTVNGEMTLLYTEVRDPATGQKRRIDGDKPFATEIDVTYDLPEYDLRLGVNFSTNAHSRAYRINEVTDTHRGVELDAFVEYKPTPEWAFRIFADNVAQSGSFRDREIYSGLRGSAPLSQVEHRALNNGAIYGLNIQRNF